MLYRISEMKDEMEILLKENHQKFRKRIEKLSEENKTIKEEESNQFHKNFIERIQKLTEKNTIIKEEECNQVADIYTEANEELKKHNQERHTSDAENSFNEETIRVIEENNELLLQLNVYKEDLDKLTEANKETVRILNLAEEDAGKQKKENINLLASQREDEDKRMTNKKHLLNLLQQLQNNIKIKSEKWYKPTQCVKLNLTKTIIDMFHLF